MLHPAQICKDGSGPNVSAQHPIVSTPILRHPFIPRGTNRAGDCTETVFYWLAVASFVRIAIKSCVCFLLAWRIVVSDASFDGLQASRFLLRSSSPRGSSPSSLLRIWAMLPRRVGGAELSWKIPLRLCVAEPHSQFRSFSNPSLFGKLGCGGGGLDGREWD